MSPNAFRRACRSTILFLISVTLIPFGVVNGDVAATLLGGIALGGLLAT